MSTPVSPVLTVPIGLFMAKIVAQTNVRHTGSVIFLHGSGDTGVGLQSWIRMILGNDGAFPHIRTIYPTAPVRPYTPMLGHKTNVWFDRSKIAPSAPEHDESIDSMCAELCSLVDEEIKSGVSERRIIIGGFSMGGAMAMQLAYRKRPGIGGVFALSSFLNHDSSVYRLLKSRDSRPAYLPPLFQCHGGRDNLVLHQWGVDSNHKMKELGVSDIQFHTFPELYHEMNRKEISLLREWIVQKLPDDSTASTKQ